MTPVIGLHTHLAAAFRAAAFRGLSLSPTAVIAAAVITTTLTCNNSRRYLMLFSFKMAPAAAGPMVSQLNLV